MASTADRVTIGILKESMTNFKESIAKLTGFVEAGNRQSSMENTDIQKSIAVLMEKQTNSEKYQSDCDNERKDLRVDVQDIRQDVNAIKVKAACISIAASSVVPVLFEVVLRVIK